MHLVGTELLLSQLHIRLLSARFDKETRDTSVFFENTHHQTRTSFSISCRNRTRSWHSCFDRSVCKQTDRGSDCGSAVPTEGVYRTTFCHHLSLSHTRTHNHVQHLSCCQDWLLFFFFNSVFSHVIDSLTGFCKHLKRLALWLKADWGYSQGPGIHSLKSIYMVWVKEKVGSNWQNNLCLTNHPILENISIRPSNWLTALNDCL